MKIHWDKIESLIVDAHVHIYPCFDVPLLLSKASENFAIHTGTSKNVDSYLSVLLLSESKNQDWFNEIYDCCSESHNDVIALGDWLISTLENDQCALLAMGPNQQRLLIIKGYQIISSENLEVLTLGASTRIEDGLPLETLMMQSLQLDAITVLPWAVGKWLGNRGKLVKQMLSEYRTQIFVGDNSGRPWFWCNDERLNFAKQKSIGKLNGSDPLPITGQEEKVAAFGSIIPRQNNAGCASEIVISSLKTSKDNIHSYGNLESVKNFVTNQIKLRC